MYRTPKQEKISSYGASMDRGAQTRGKVFENQAEKTPRHQVIQGTL